AVCLPLTDRVTALVWPDHPAVRPRVGGQEPGRRLLRQPCPRLLRPACPGRSTAAASGCCRDPGAGDGRGQADDRADPQWCRGAGDGLGCGHHGEPAGDGGPVGDGEGDADAGPAGRVILDGPVGAGWRVPATARASRRVLAQNPAGRPRRRVGTNSPAEPSGAAIIPARSKVSIMPFPVVSIFYGAPSGPLPLADTHAVIKQDPGSAARGYPLEIQSCA